MSDEMDEDHPKRPVRIANCSGAATDPGYQLLRQATQGHVDFITGDYLAEMNIAELAVAQQEGRGEGWTPTAWCGIEQTVEILAEKKIKVVLNGGGLNPEGLARKIDSLIRSKKLNLTVAWVSGDDFSCQTREQVRHGIIPEHLDAGNQSVVVHPKAKDMLLPGHEIVTANAYLGARGIVQALEAGADIVICGRVSDASLVVGPAWYWHKWADTDYDRLAGALIGGHIIECSAYATGGNFTGFDELELDTLLDLPFGICEISNNGSIEITKHEGAKGHVNMHTVTAQLLYELQGTTYLNSDVTAHIDFVQVTEVASQRVAVSGIRGRPPPPTTKLAIFHKAGFESQILLNANGYGIQQKFKLFKRQIEFGVEKNKLREHLDVLRIEQIGTPARNPRDQSSSTVYFRILAQAAAREPLLGLWASFAEFGMQHYSGMHFSLDFRTATPRPILAFYPGTVQQSALSECAHVIRGDHVSIHPAGHPSAYEIPGKRASYDSAALLPVPNVLVDIRLGDILLGRSGDKGANVSLALWPRTRWPEMWTWLRHWLSRKRLASLLGDDYDHKLHHIERVEFSGCQAVHSVIYGILGRGVSCATMLDSLGKGLVDYVRDKEVSVPPDIVQKGTRKIMQWD